MWKFYYLFHGLSLTVSQTVKFALKIGVRKLQLSKVVSMLTAIGTWMTDTLFHKNIYIYFKILRFSIPLELIQKRIHHVVFLFNGGIDTCYRE